MLDCAVGFVIDSIVCRPGHETLIAMKAFATRIFYLLGANFHGVPP